MLKGIGIVGMSSLPEGYFATLTLGYLLGQGFNSQPLVSDDGPTHGLPFPAGLLQVRVFVCMPSEPHDLVQSVLSHAVHCPSPERRS